MESWEAFIVFCRTEVDYKIKYDEKVKRESAIPKFISVIGSIDEPQYFMVDFDNITYKIFTLAKAIDIVSLVNQQKENLPPQYINNNIHIYTHINTYTYRYIHFDILRK